MIPEDLIIVLNIDVNYSNINPSSAVSYESSITDQFTVLGLEPNSVVMYTLQVIRSAVSEMILNIGMSRTGSFTVMSTTTAMSTTKSSTAITTTNSLASTTRSTSSGILYSKHEVFY